MGKLQLIYFYKLQYLQPATFIFTYRVWDVPRSLRSQEKYRNISGNLLFCDCHAMYFKRWLSKHPVIEASCYEPQKLRGAALKKLTEVDMEKCRKLFFII